MRLKLKTLGNFNDCKELIIRIQNLHPLQPAWCSLFTARDILPHLADPIRVALGKKSAKTGTWMYWIFSWPIINWLTSQVLPWPPVPAQPEFLPWKQGTKPENFEEDKKLLISLIAEIFSSDGPFVEHPVFGKLTPSEWKRLMWRHIDYHLKKFDK